MGCEAPVKAVLKRVEGVLEVEVSFKERKAAVVYDAEKVSPENLVEAVNKTGIFTATIPPPPEAAAEETNKEDQ